MRGYAILGVWIVHTGQFSSAIADWTVWGRYGVQLFFVVSAFTLTLSWHERPQTISAFFVRRFFRIAPMFWLAILLFAGLNWFEAAPQDRFTFWQIAATVCFLHGLNPVTNNLVVPGDWSIAVEMMFYLLFPVVMTLATNLKRSFLFLIVALVLFRVGLAVNASLLAWVFPEQPRVLLSAYWWTSLPCNLIVFAIGIFGYWVARSQAFANLPDAAARVAFYLALLVTAVALIRLQNTVIFFSLGFAAILFARNTGSFWNNGVVRHLGKISFSGYLLHFLFVHPAVVFAQEFTSNEWAVYLVALAVVAVLTTAFATLTYLLIEKPFIMVGRAVSNRLAQSPWQDAEPAANHAPL